MATSQMPAATTSGRYMSALVKSVSPALKLMNVLTTATDASEMPVAAGIPRSRTRPDVCRTKSRVDGVLPTLAVPAVPAGTDASLLVTGLPPASASPERESPNSGQQDPLLAQAGCHHGQARTRNCQYLWTYVLPYLTSANARRGEGGGSGAGGERCRRRSVSAQSRNRSSALVPSFT